MHCKVVKIITGATPSSFLYILILYNFICVHTTVLSSCQLLRELLSALKNFNYEKLSKLYLLVFATLHNLFSNLEVLYFIKAELLARYGGVAPKMAEEAHALVIDQVHPVNPEVLCFKNL